MELWHKKRTRQNNYVGFIQVRLIIVNLNFNKHLTPHVTPYSNINLIEGINTRQKKIMRVILEIIKNAVSNI